MKVKKKKHHRADDVEKVKIGPYSYSSRELSQIIRRKMTSKSVRDKTVYSRKLKHKGSADE